MVSQDGMTIVTTVNAKRHPKWVQVPPGRTIEPGQSYRIEYRFGDNGQTAKEAVNDGDDQCYVYLTSGAELFIDSTWSAPLDLPTEPTWGIVVDPDGHLYGPYRWRFNAIKNRFYSLPISPQYGLGLDRVADFIPLTPDQVARIEAAR